MDKEQMMSTDRAAVKMECTVFLLYSVNLKGDITALYFMTFKGITVLAIFHKVMCLTN